MKKHAVLAFAIIVAGGLHAHAEPTVSARVVGEAFGKVDADIVVTAEEQTLLHAHSDFEQGGTWYQATISVKDGHVTIAERDSISTPYKSGHKVHTIENIYRLPVDKIEKDEVELRHGNRIVLSKAEAARPAAESTPAK